MFSHVMLYTFLLKLVLLTTVYTFFIVEANNVLPLRVEALSSLPFKVRPPNLRGEARFHPSLLY